MHQNEFKQRRQELMDLMGNDSIAILSTAPERTRNRDVHYAYRPDSDFYYLTGFAEPEAVAVLMPNRPQGEYLLFCREKNPDQEIWHGRRAGLEGACEQYGADDAFPITDLEDILPGLMERCHRLYYAMGYYPELDERVISWMNQLREKQRQGVNPPKEMITLDHVLHEMRLQKMPAELEAMRKAVSIAARGHIRAMQVCRPEMYEYQLEAELIHAFMHDGSHYPAYPSIVGGGANSCILHYTENNAQLHDGDLVLIDAGAEYDYYASDITRTFPVNGKFSEPQRLVYELVLKAQLAAIDKARADNHWNHVHEAAVEVIAAGLLELGLLSGSLAEVLEKETYKNFFMHRTGHWIGMDVHDVGGYKIAEEWRVLEPGMVMTVEPGIYIAAETAGIDPQWWNIGVRIEDDVVVTTGEPEVLSAAVPKTVAEIEALMGSD